MHRVLVYVMIAILCGITAAVWPHHVNESGPDGHVANEGVHTGQDHTVNERVYEVPWVAVRQPGDSFIRWIDQHDAETVFLCMSDCPEGQYPRFDGWIPGDDGPVLVDLEFIVCAGELVFMYDIVPARQAHLPVMTNDCENVHSCIPVRDVCAVVEVAPRTSRLYGVQLQDAFTYDPAYREFEDLPWGSSPTGIGAWKAPPTVLYPVRDGRVIPPVLHEFIMDDMLRTLLRRDPTQR